MHTLTPLDQPLPPQPLLLIGLQLISRPIPHPPLLHSPQSRIRPRIIRAPQTRIPLVIQPAILHPQMPQKRPHLRVPPLEHGMHPHERGPAMVRRVKGRE